MNKTDNYLDKHREWEKSSYSSDTDKETYMRATLESPEKLKRKKWTVTLVIDDKENEYLYGTKEDAKKFIDGYGFSVDSDIDEDDNNTIKVGISVLGNKENNRVATYMSEEDGFLVKGSEEGEYIFERKALENEDKAVELANDWINKDGEFK